MQFLSDKCVEQYKHFCLLDEEFALCKAGGGPSTCQAEFADFLRQKQFDDRGVGQIGTGRTGPEHGDQYSDKESIATAFCRVRDALFSWRMAAPVVQQFDPKGSRISNALFRECTKTRFIDGTAMKDLVRLNRDLSKLNPENVLRVPKWEGNMDDRTLIDLAELLKSGRRRFGGHFATAGPMLAELHSHGAVEPQLRKLGMPTRLENGGIALARRHGTEVAKVGHGHTAGKWYNLLEEFNVCKADDQLSADQARILKRFGQRLAQFCVRLLARVWKRGAGRRGTGWEAEAGRRLAVGGDGGNRGGEAWCGEAGDGRGSGGGEASGGRRGRGEPGRGSVVRGGGGRGGVRRVTGWGKRGRGGVRRGQGMGEAGAGKRGAGRRGTGGEAEAGRRLAVGGDGGNRGGEAWCGEAGDGRGSGGGEASGGRRGRGNRGGEAWCGEAGDGEASDG
ncbi:hypothetical protein niasHS_016745 [Heterodera schachtii]|uniref:Uncharacterized protein n=1 Tax=Heterodera schachtii TaxID=97005 RepID=A0ABD2HR16_HETSC